MDGIDLDNADIPVTLTGSWRSDHGSLTVLSGTVVCDDWQDDLAVLSMCNIISA